MHCRLALENQITETPAISPSFQIVDDCADWTDPGVRTTKDIAGCRGQRGSRLFCASLPVITNDARQSNHAQFKFVVTGPITVTLRVATSARDTDFTAALMDVYPDGRAMELTHGILRLQYRYGVDHATPAKPNQIYEIEIDLIATSNLFRAGHQIAVEVSSSNFPRFDRNPNTAGVIAEMGDNDCEVAHQRIFHDAVHPSYVTLPLVSAQ